MRHAFNVRSKAHPFEQADRVGVAEGLRDCASEIVTLDVVVSDPVTLSEASEL